MPPFQSPFLSVQEFNPLKPAGPLSILILSDLQSTPQRVAHLSAWLSAHNKSFSVDLVLVIGITRPHKNLTPSDLGNESATLAELEQICPRVIYVPGLYEPQWDSVHRLTSASVNALLGPVHVTDDLTVVHRRYADGLSERTVHQLPESWRSTVYSKHKRPIRFRTPPNNSVIVLCSSQLPQQPSGILQTVRSLLSLARSPPELDIVLAIAPPRMQRLKSTSNVTKVAQWTVDPGSFADGHFCIAELRRPDVWDPLIDDCVDEDVLKCESAWEVVNVEKYNLDRDTDD